jgi:hypothetical protein
MLQNLNIKLQKGLILFNPRTLLDNGKIKPKFFLLMENPTHFSKSLVAFLTTTKPGSPKCKVYFEEPFFERNSAYAILSKHYDLCLGEIKKNYFIKGILAPDQIHILERAIGCSYLVPERFKRRIARQAHKQTEEHTKTRYYKYQLWSPEEISAIKVKLGFGQHDYNYL